MDLLVGGGGFADSYTGGFRRYAGADEIVGEGAEISARHVDDQRGVFGEGSGPFRSDFELACSVVGGGEDEFGG